MSQNQRCVRYVAGSFCPYARLIIDTIHRAMGYKKAIATSSGRLLKGLMDQGFQLDVKRKRCLGGARGVRVGERVYPVVAKGSSYSRLISQILPHQYPSDLDFLHLVADVHPHPLHQNRCTRQRKPQQHAYDA